MVGIPIAVMDNRAMILLPCLIYVLNCFYGLKPCRPFNQNLEPTRRAIDCNLSSIYPRSWCTFWKLHIIKYDENIASAQFVKKAKPRKIVRLMYGNFLEIICLNQRSSSRFFWPARCDHRFPQMRRLTDSFFGLSRDFCRNLKAGQLQFRILSLPNVPLA